MLGVSAVQATELGDIARLSKSGASELALALLDQEQPDYSADASRWMRWERMRVRILEQRGLWQPLEKRLRQLPEGLPGDFLRWAQTRRAQALIQDERPAEARQILRALIWSGEGSGEELPRWRQLVMQSYLRQGKTEDAFVAMLRYHQDYGEGGEEELLMRARILFASDHPAEVRSLLDAHRQDRTLGLLHTLARLRAGESPAPILRALREARGLAQYSELQRYLHYGVMAEAALAAAEPAFVIIALEQWYRLEVPQGRWRELFDFDADTLWQAYLDYGEKVGNAQQLLIGNDEAWLRLAAETPQRYPVRKRSLYALLAQKAFSPANREKAGVTLVRHLLELENGIAVVRQLYLNSRYYHARSPVPPGVSYILVDQAIRDGDLPVASRLMRQLPEPPEDTEKFHWQLRRVKVFILAGENEAAVELLSQLIPEVASLGREQRDQLMQLLFDLQNVGEHASAVALLQELYRRIPNLQFRRELLFWMADSRLAQGEYVAAARLYLQSATLGDTQSMDPWAQTARYKAAETLARGGMLGDAAQLYAQLLRVTESAERRAVLLHELERVRMRQAADAKR